MGYGRIIALLILASCSSKATPDAGVDPGDDGGLSFCPAFLDFELIASEARSDPGWTGIAHGTTLSTGSAYTLETFNCDDECRRCKTRGPVRSPASVNRSVVNQRCLNDTTAVCASDAECGDVATDPEAICRFMYPPVSVTVAGLSACAQPYLEPTGAGPPIVGTFDLKTGEASFLENNVVLKNTASLSGASCPNCDGDMNPMDGNATGTCSAGPRAGMACDIHGVSNGSPAALTSWDCPPSTVGAFVSPLPVAAQGLTTASVAWSLDDTRPFCTESSSTTERCWCGVCNPSGAACFRDSQCPTGETCGFAGPGDEFITANNQCPETDGGPACIWDSEAEVGACADDSGKACFPDDQAIQARGSAEVRNGFYISTLAGLLCLPASPDSLSNSIVGFPGPVYIRYPYRVTPIEQ